MTAVRRSIDIDGFGHGNNPVPAASLLGGLLVSGAIFGMDPTTRKIVPGLQAQCDLMFGHAQRILEAAGADWSRVLKMVFYLAPDQPRDCINAHWLRLFPDAASRPARHVVINDRLPPGTLIQCDLLALAPSA
ncbi:MAG: RidA family protein [Hydrogenophaga sp.]|uniref:RidA family protein n=1 Tax=Hydrogenophaga sp. TaxID=1904254 RepID=UPI00257EAD0B|nr:RidA family protein [Hydrogenophaga sp.]MBL0945151.1 RidA family protein [Hydrogenophaga sp.]